MTETITLNLATPVSSVELLENYGPQNAQYQSQSNLTEQLENEKQRLVDLCRGLENITKKINSLYQKSISENRVQIAELAVEIAGKILNQKIEDDNYEIKPIIQDVLNSSPGGKEIKLSLNPVDFEHCKKMQDDEQFFTNVTFIADPDVKRTDCILESSKGNIESFVDGKLKQIAEEFKRIV